MRSALLSLSTIALTATTLSAAAPQQPAAHECFVLMRPGETTPFVSDAAECAVATSPASTFKIPHALIALQTGVAQATTVFPWDGTSYGYEAWRRPHTLDSAIKWSARPVFDHTARQIGRARMRASLAAFAYAADTLEGEENGFWVDGDLVVSPLEQVAFLGRLFAGTLPVDARHLAFVRDAMRTTPGEITLGAGAGPFELDWPAGSIVWAKTGNTVVKGERVSWLIGAIESSGRTWLFAARTRSRGTLENTAGAEVARRGLNASRK